MKKELPASLQEFIAGIVPAILMSCALGDRGYHWQAMFAASTAASFAAQKLFWFIRNRICA